LNKKEYNIAVERHANNLFGYVVKYLRNKQDAQDIVQDVFEKLWKRRKQIPLENSKAWMFRTGHNALINFSTRHKRTVYGNEHMPEKTVAVDRSFENQEVIDLALSLLPPVQKSIVLLRDLEGYNYADIGEILELSESQVKVYLYRARKKIKKQLKNLTIIQ